MAEHLERGEHLRELIDGRRRETRARSERFAKEGRRQKGGVAVHRRIADVRRERVSAVAQLNFRKAVGRFVERCFPADFRPRVARAPQGMRMRSGSVCTSFIPITLGQT